MTAFELPGPRDLLSDAGGNVADLQSFRVDAEINALCIPSVNATCFLSAAIIPSDWPLPATNAAIYLRELYAGSVYVNPDTADDKFILSLGQDERLNVTRRELPVKMKDVFLKGQRRKSHEYEIKLVNRSSETVKVLIIECVPVSTDKEIVVDVTELSNGRLDEETGEVRWDASLEGHGNRKLRIAYSITWPKNKDISRYTKYLPL